MPTCLVAAADAKALQAARETACGCRCAGSVGSSGGGRTASSASDTSMFDRDERALAVAVVPTLGVLARGEGTAAAPNADCAAAHAAVAPGRGF